MFESLATILILLVHIGAIAWLLIRERRQPSATLAWLLALIFIPGFGLVLYVVFGVTRARRVVRRSRLVEERIRGVLERHGVLESLVDAGEGGLNARTKSFLKLARGLATTPPSLGNRVRVLPTAAQTYRKIIEAVEAAEHHIHLEFYIIQPDRPGTQMRDRLVRRAAEGIRVRVLCDAIGSSGLPKGFWAPLREAGGQAAYFRPVWSFLARFRNQDRVDFRNHRKIVVVDGRVGFTGGINIGSEYLGMDESVGHWRDTQVRIEGPAALSLQQAFAEDWLRTTDELLDDARYFPDPETPGDCKVQIVDSGPDRKWSPISHVLTHAMELARERIWITSPYFVPSLPVEHALVSAALRGVDVRLLVPAKSDNRIACWAGRTWFRPLLEAGLRIYRYERGFVHAKTMVFDHWIATIGSANLDMRSFHLNYELNAFVSERGIVDELAELFRRDLRHSSEVDLASETKVGIGTRLVGNAARLLSPLL